MIAKHYVPLIFITISSYILFLETIIWTAKAFDVFKNDVALSFEIWYSKKNMDMMDGPKNVRWTKGG